MRRYPLLKIPTVTDAAHVSDVMSVLRFSHITKPILSSPIIGSQVEETNDKSYTCFFYVYSEHFGQKTKFIYN